MLFNGRLTMVSAGAVGTDGGKSAGTRILRGGRTGLTGPAAAAKEEGGHAHDVHGTRLSGAVSVPRAWLGP
jgi:hypothetical protein